MRARTPVSLIILATLASGTLAATGLPQPAPTSSRLGVLDSAQTGGEARLLTGARIVDGSGSAAFAGEVLVRSDRIVAIGAPGSLPREPGTVVDDLAGLVLAPGFVDIHNHSTGRLRRDPLATTQIAQGVTTIVVGADGGSPWPIDEYLADIDDLRPALDVGVLVGHGTVRHAVLGDDFRRVATEAEVAAMAQRVEAGMAAGALGLSSGLEYDPGFYSDTEELIVLARVAARHRGFYMSHIRDEEEGILEAVGEAIRIGEEARLPVQISHIKAGNASVWGKSGEVLALIDAARRRGVDVLADQYPYTAWQSGLGIVVRSRRFQDPEAVAAGLEAAGGGERLQIVNYGADASAHGLRLSELAVREGVSEVEMYMRIMANGGSGVIGHTMSEADVEAFMVSPWVMISSDGGVGSAHPRGAGAFARQLGYYVRERELLSLERAVQRASSMPAARAGLADRGRILPGMRADLVAFDPAEVAARSTFAEPLHRAVGVARTWVAGELVWRDGEPAGARPGRSLRRR